MAKSAERIILFDGVCGLCTGLIPFLLIRDNARLFRFAALQSVAGQQLLRIHGLNTTTSNSLLLIEGDRIWMRSTAVLRIFRCLPGGWRLLYGFIVFPRPIRDLFYRVVAHCRYRLFGRHLHCMVDWPGWGDRFLT